MRMFRAHTLQDNGGVWLLTLYVDGEQEFSSELGQVAEEECQQKLGERVRRYIAENIPNLCGRNLTIKIMAGAVVIGTLSVGGTEVTLASTAALPTKTKTGFQRKNSQGIGVILNGDELDFEDQPPEFVNSRTMVPLRKVFESMGAVVGYDNASKIITITKGGTSVVLKQNSNVATVNGRQVTMDQPAIVLGGRTLVPLRFVSESLGVQVDWDQATSTAFLTTDDGTGVQPPAQASPVLAEQSPATDSTTGAASVAVRELQQDLQALGYFNAPVSGIVDSATANAVTSFQVAYGLNVTGISGASTQTAITHALVKRSIVSDARKFLGTPYRWGGATPQTGFDCSGFVNYMFTTHGVSSIPRTTSGDLYKRGSSVAKANLQPGDLVYFAINKPGVISHVGIYLGNNQFISATSSKGIAIASLDNPYWGPHYFGANRVY